jgi:hypothetical protein
MYGISHEDRRFIINNFDDIINTIKEKFNEEDFRVAMHAMSWSGYVDDHIIEECKKTKI